MLLQAEMDDELVVLIGNVFPGTTLNVLKKLSKNYAKRD